jgi:hypothetical protein
MSHSFCGAPSAHTGLCFFLSSASLSYFSHDFVYDHPIISYSKVISYETVRICFPFILFFLFLLISLFPFHVICRFSVAQKFLFLLHRALEISTYHSIIVFYCTKHFLLLFFLGCCFITFFASQKTYVLPSSLHELHFLLLLFQTFCQTPNTILSYSYFMLLFEASHQAP